MRVDVGRQAKRKDRRRVGAKHVARDLRLRDPAHAHHRERGVPGASKHAISGGASHQRDAVDRGQALSEEVAELGGDLVRRRHVLGGDLGVQLLDKNLAGARVLHPIEHLAQQSKR